MALHVEGSISSLPSKLPISVLRSEQKLDVHVYPVVYYK